MFTVPQFWSIISKGLYFFVLTVGLFIAVMFDEPYKAGAGSIEGETVN